MVYGIGCDLCSIARMEKSLLGPSLDFRMMR